ncbi:MAG: sialate O-acetylesterase [Verrucomicrobiota bacterium]
MKIQHLLFAALGLAAFSVRADVVPNPLFSDGAVLQQGIRVPIWGTAAPGEKVTVEFEGQSVSATAGADGKWSVDLAPLKAGGPHTLTIAGNNKIVLKDILVGEVWVCSGQSNMERHLGLQDGQKPITNWELEVAAATHPDIRQFYVNKKTALTPLSTVTGGWSMCSPETVKDFTAVGYFFGRDLYAAMHVPIGLIHSSWGGTPAEAWTSEAGLKALPEFAGQLESVKQLAANPEQAKQAYKIQLDAWYRAKDPGSDANPPWSAETLDTAGWKPMTLPTFWEAVGYPGFDGIFWFRRTIDLSESWTNHDAELHLGAIDDIDTTWVNGVQVGATSGYDQPRVYHVPAGLLKAGANVIAVRVLDTGAGGGLYGGKDTMRLAGAGGEVVLTGDWLSRQGPALAQVGWPPQDMSQSAGAPTVLYNAMIAPLLPYAIRGVIWYQGEANVGREKQYQTLFPALIADWRRLWGEGDFPFLFVQIAPYNGMTPEIREAQLLTWRRTTNTAMAVTIDCGDADDIHPAHKQPVGQRLALAALALAYGQKIEYSGPAYESMTVKGKKATLNFSHLDGGLVAKGGTLTGFTMAGPDKVFHPAKAVIKGKTVVVTCDAVSKPQAVRYGWANVPEGNLFNGAGLPASPFRTDAD